MTWLAVAGALNMALAVYYYLAPVARMYLQESPGPIDLPGATGYTSALCLCLTGTLWLGLLPHWPLQAIRAIGSLLP